jgi:hypothetical protein
MYQTMYQTMYQALHQACNNSSDSCSGKSEIATTRSPRRAFQNRAADEALHITGSPRKLRMTPKNGRTTAGKQKEIAEE